VLLKITIISGFQKLQNVVSEHKKTPPEYGEAF
jgi:hypothetical protein